jgi:hypothetical protein
MVPGIGSLVPGLFYLLIRPSTQYPAPINYTPLYALNPPSTGITTPVTNLDKSETR